MTKYKVGLDFETYSGVSLPDYGLHRYVRDSTFRTLCAGVAHADEAALPVTNRFDFVNDGYSKCRRDLYQYIGGNMIVAHNVPFEQMVLSKMGLDYPVNRFIDSAVVSRAAGAGGRLEAAAPQLLNTDKVEAGKNLMKLFSIPGKYQEKNGTMDFDPAVVREHPDEWEEYLKYCEIDALLGLRLVDEWGHLLTNGEQRFQEITLGMNTAGWCVDVHMVEEMQRRYLENQTEAVGSFRERLDRTGELNLNSHKQLTEWCAVRGMKLRSFDEKHVARYLAVIDKKFAASRSGAAPLTNRQAQNYWEVEQLLLTKQVLGGSSLKKLQVILDTAVPDDDRPGKFRLKDQYLHCGAGQTLRTTGRSAQMQNLKRLDAENIGNLDELDDDDSVWDNNKLAENIRQVFTASHEDGVLVVGDFKSVESRGLGWMAGAHWKSDAYRRGQDLYKVLATKIYGVGYDDVTKAQRQVGKVGELSCGYGAGAGAVRDFAANMGVTFTEEEAAQLVHDWRTANPEVLSLWNTLDEDFTAVVHGLSTARVISMPDQTRLIFRREPTPVSLTNQHRGAVSVAVVLESKGGVPLMKRVFHGCYTRGRDICYYKPSDRKTGDLWRQSFINPKTKQRQFYKLYGGKLAGIITQSLCRELFFEALHQVEAWTAKHDNLMLVGQFHDEIVLDWWPSSSGIVLSDVEYTLASKMSSPGWAPSFPLGADVKYDYRYTK